MRVETITGRWMWILESHSNTQERCDWNITSDLRKGRKNSFGGEIVVVEQELCCEEGV
jgi:hypothetical protein